MELVVTGLTAVTSRQYVATFRWLQDQCPGPWQHRRTIQTFLDKQTHKFQCSLKARIIQSIANNRLSPVLQGPSVKLPLRRRCALQEKRHSLDAGSYIPVYIQREIHHHRTAMQLLHCFIEHLAPCDSRRDYIRTQVSYIWNGCLILNPNNPWAIGRDEILLAVQQRYGVGGASRTLAGIALNNFIQSVLHRHNIAQCHAMRIPRPRRPRGWRMQRTVRDHFKQEEIDQLMLQSMSIRERLMMCILKETGLRRRALSSLTVHGVTSGDICMAMEKGGHTRTFIISPATRQLLNQYLSIDHPGNRTPWLFPSATDHRRPTEGRHVNMLVQRLCKQAGIEGRFTHSHAIRKFVAVTLMANKQNRIEDVCKFLGHTTTNNTFNIYWDVDSAEVTKGMNIPWLNSEYTTTHTSEEM